MKPALFIDRDGTINKDCPYCKSPEQINIFEDVFDPLKELSKYFLIIIITNQSGISRGFFTEDDLKEMHEKIKRQISEKGGRIDAIYYCPHLPEDNCNCRKPKTGLVEKAMNDFDIDLKGSFVIGNDDKDVELAKNLKIRSIKVRNDSPSKGDYNVKDFNEVLDIISKIRLVSQE